MIFIVSMVFLYSLSIVNDVKIDILININDIVCFVE